MSSLTPTNLSNKPTYSHEETDPSHYTAGSKDVSSSDQGYNPSMNPSEPDSPDSMRADKEERRKMSNRASAAKYRTTKKAESKERDDRIDTLTRRIDEKDATIAIGMIG
ncbi:uncharacterized protein I206_106453 [Kwoniella pini CBS 10737]|uniref:BZIP domain-containing protein n=1 Tax=Kwoniella pini CBS 10737 TaxID=1296096 RepID=A0AAJ8LAW4_9TREE